MLKDFIKHKAGKVMICLLLDYLIQTRRKTAGKVQTYTPNPDLSMIHENRLS